MASLPVEVLYGVYLGVLTGVLPSLVSWALGFAVKYVTGVSLPGFGAMALGLAIAGAQGGLLALADPSVVGSTNQVRISVALLVVVSATLYSHSVGDRMGATLPKRITLRSLRERTLSSDVVELVGGRGRVRVAVTGEVEDVEGYPPAPAELRERVRTEELVFPADLPLVELEARVADQLRETFELQAVEVTLDERARATVAVAPPVAGLSRRVPARHRAVSVETPLPSGLAPSDEVAVTVAGAASTGDERSVEGTVVAVRPGEDGSGRVTVAVPRDAAPALLAGDPERLVVRSRGTRREFEFVRLLRRAGGRVRRLTVEADDALDGVTVGEARERVAGEAADGRARERAGVAVLAVHRDGEWTIAPAATERLAPGDDCYVAGPRGAVEALAEVAA
jgi:hypothetical protein